MVMKSIMPSIKSMYIILMLYSYMLKHVYSQLAIDYDSKVHQDLELNVEKQYFFNGTHYNQTIYLKYIVPQDLDPDADLVLIARPNDFKSDPDVFVSKTIQFATPDNADYRCWHSGLDICYIPYNWIKGNKEIYLTLFSFQPYSNFTFEAKFQHRIDELLEWNKDTVIFLGRQDNSHNQSQQILKIYVPPEESIEHFTFSVTVDQNSRQSLHEAVKLYVMFGNDYPSNSRSLWGIYSTSYGETFTSFKDQPTFRTGTNYTLLIIGQTNTTVNVLCRKDTSDPIKLKFNPNSDKQKTLFDAIPYAKSLVYELDTGLMTRDETTKKLNQTLIINLLVQQGNPDMYIDCDDIVSLQSLHNAKWISDSSGFETLMIGQTEFENYSKTCNKIFITIYSRVCAAFALEFSIRDQFANDDIVLPIYPSISENGYIENYQIVSYLLQMEKTADEIVTVSLTAKNGNPDLYIRKCKDIKNCKMTREELDNIQNVDKSEFIGLSNQIGNDYINFHHSSDNCEKSNSIFCLYLISIYATNTVNKDIKPTEMHYSLLVQYQSKSTKISENTPLYQKLNIEQFNYYSFSLVSLEDIKKVYFQVTPISGIMELMVSRFHEQPNFRATEKIACFCSNVISYSIEEIKQLNQQSTNFYMSVYGFSNSVYTITIYIERYQKEDDGTNNPDSSIILMNLIIDIPQKYVYENNSDYVYFDIFENVSDPVVSLNPLKGEFKIDAWPLYSSNQNKYNPPAETSGETVYSSNYNSVILHVKNAQDQNNLKGFRVRIQKLSNREQSQFIIDYSTESVITMLYHNQPIQTFIQPDSTKFFKFIINPQDFIVALSYTSSHTGLVMSLSGDAIHKDDAKIKYETSGMSESSIYMFNAYYEECEKQNKIIDDCVVYGMIEMSESAQKLFSEEKKKLLTSVSLVTFNRQLIAENIQLKDGNISYYPIPIEESKQSDYYTFNFYVHPTSFDESTQGIITLEHGNLKVKYVVQDTSGDGMSKPNMWSYPQLNENEARTLTQNDPDKIKTKVQEHIFIRKNQYLCKPKCVILISVFVKNIQKIEQNSMLNVQVFSGVIDISNMQSIEVTGNVAYNSYKYYRIHLPNQETILNISAIALQSQLDINLVASYQTRAKPVEGCKPCIQSTLEKGNYDEVQFTPAKSGDYLIGVYGTEGYSIDYKLFWNVNQMQIVRTNQDFLVYLHENGFKNTNSKSYIFYPDLLQYVGFNLLFTLDFDNDSEIKLSITDCQSDFLKGCQIDEPNYKTINARNALYLYSDVCKNLDSCILVLQFASNDSKQNIQFHSFIQEKPKISNEYVIETITISSDQPIIANISKYQKRRYKINLPFGIDDVQKTQDKYIFRVKQITGNVNISLYPKENMRKVSDGFETFKWIEINSSALQQGNFIYVDVFGCNVATCTFDLVLYKSHATKDISKLFSFAEYLSKDNPIIIKATNEIFKNYNLLINYDNQNNQLMNEVISIQKNGDQVKSIVIQASSHYHMLSEIYDKAADPNKEIIIFISLESTKNTIKPDDSIIMGVLLVKIDGQQIALKNTPQTFTELKGSLNQNIFESSQLSANYIVELPEQGSIIIEIHGCDGQLSLNGSSTLNKFQEGEFDLSFTSKNKDSTLYFTQISQPGKIYLKISRQSSQFGKKQRYQIASYFFDISTNPMNSPIFDISVQSGIIEIQRINNNHQINWEFMTGSQSFNNPKNVLKHAQFILIIGINSPEQLQSAQRCSFDNINLLNQISPIATSKQQASILLNSDSIQFDESNHQFYTQLDLKELFIQNLPKFNDDLLSDDMKIFISIKALLSPQIYSESQSQLKHIVWFNEFNYDVTSIDKSYFQEQQVIIEDPQSASSHTILIFTIVTGLCLILLGIFLYRRYRLTKKKLEFEVSYREEPDFSQEDNHQIQV